MLDKNEMAILEFECGEFFGENPTGPNLVREKKHRRAKRSNRKRTSVLKDKKLTATEQYLAKALDVERESTAGTKIQVRKVLAKTSAIRITQYLSKKESEKAASAMDYYLSVENEIAGAEEQPNEEKESEKVA